MARNYSAEYQNRLAIARAAGFTSPREATAYRRAKKANTAAGKKLTVYNFRQKKEAQQRARQKQQQKIKVVKQKQTLKQKTAILKKFRISEQQLNKMRRENRAYNKVNKIVRQNYDLKLDRAINDWSEERIGYITGYNEVFVHDKTKTLKGKAREKLIEKYEKIIAAYVIISDETEEWQKYERERNRNK